MQEHCQTLEMKFQELLNQGVAADYRKLIMVLLLVSAREKVSEGAI